MIYYDPRWQGSHGIGRFAANITERIEAEPLKISGNPAAPLDPLLLTLALQKVPRGNVFFSPGFNPPLVSSIPFVFTIHDLNHIDRHENSGPMKWLYYNMVLKHACHRAEHVLTISDFSKQRIVEWSGVLPEKVVNVGNGVDDAYHTGVKPLDSGYRYLLCMNNRKLHKNDHRVIEAFARAELPADVRLVMVGNSTSDLSLHIRRHGLTERVVFMGQVPEAELPSLYRGAVALLFPSLYEGFGLPVIESMACGTPVITSNTTALPEVAGGAALLVNPESLMEIASAISHLFNDAELRAILREKGLQRAACFKWENTARKVREVLEECSGR